MAKNKMKNIKLRAFSIKSTDLSTTNRDILIQLKEKLKGSLAKDRQMRLNSEDPTGEQDIMSNFSFGENLILGTILRIIPEGSDEHIDASLLEKQTFTTEEITKHDANGAASVKKRYHICLDGLNIVTDLPRTITVKRIETYINWLLKTYIFQFTPKIVRQPNLNLADIKDITFLNPLISHSENEKILDSSLKRFDVKKCLDILLADAQDMKDIDLEQVISAQLILKFKKPRKMTTEEYECKFSAMLKPISDLEDVSFRTKKGQKISSENLLLEKPVQIEFTESGFVSENQLNREMQIFLSELKNDEKS